MTLKQMEYVLAVAKCASFSEAAKRLYISQPSLSETIKKLEDELGFTIFIRESSGLKVTVEGEEYLNAIQGIVDQVSNLEKHYEKNVVNTLKFSVSVIHYFFMGEVFAELINKMEDKGLDSYDVKLLDTGTLQVITDVVNGLSDIGIVSYTEHNKTYIMRELKKVNLECNEITATKLYAFLRGGHPLADRRSIRLKELEPYPYASLWQRKSSMYYFTEEGIFLPSNQKKIFVKDCGAMRVLIKDTDAFAMGTGVIPADVNMSETRAVEVSDAPITTVCWIKRSGTELSEIAKEFLRLCAAKMGRNLPL